MTSSQFLECGALVVAPELGAAIQRGEVDHGLGVATRAPVGGTAGQVLGNVKAEGHRHLLLLNSRDVQIGRRGDALVCHLHQVVNGLHLTGAEYLTGGELGGDDGRGEVGKDRLTVGTQAEQDVGHKDGH